MYSENLDKLIELALADGVLTEKEKEVLFKKAEAEGIDHDEFEMVLDGMLFEKNKSKTETTTVAPKSDKFGDVKKCPSCGAVEDSFTTKCSDCGYDFRNIQTTSSVQKLFEMINNLDKGVNIDSNEANPLKAFGGLMVNALSSRLSNRAKEQQKKDIISNFPVPNTKEDIIEFLSLAMPKATAPKIKIYGFIPIADYPMTITWKEKCQQIIMKARFAMKDDKKTLEEIEYYAKQLNIK